MTNPTERLERDLVEHLRAQGSRAPGGDGWDGILGRVERRRRHRQQRRVALTALTLVAVVGALVAAGGRMGPGGDPVDSGPAAPSTADGLPRLVLGVAGYELAHASELSVAEQPPPSSPSQPGSMRLSVLAEGDRGYDGRVLFVTVADPGAGYGVGDRSEAARRVTVGTNVAWVQQHTGLPVTSLGWYLPTGEAVHLVGLRLGEDDLLAVGRELQVSADGSITWRAGPPPAGLALQRTTDAPLGPRATTEVRYIRGPGGLVLRLQEGGDAVLDDLVRDRAAAALEIGTTAVGGVPAVQAVYAEGGRTTVMWQARPGVVAELVATGPATADLPQAVTSIREVDEVAWRQLVDRFTRPVEGPVPDAPVADEARRLASVVEVMCTQRRDWLNGDGGDAPLQILQDVRAHAIEVGLDRNSDIVPVLDRLLAAMAAGDEATVRSIPAGGACR